MVSSLFTGIFLKKKAPRLSNKWKLLGIYFAKLFPRQLENLISRIEYCKCMAVGALK